VPALAPLALPLAVPEPPELPEVVPEPAVAPDVVAPLVAPLVSVPLPICVPLAPAVAPLAPLGADTPLLGVVPLDVRLPDVPEPPDVLPESPATLAPLLAPVVAPGGPSDSPLAQPPKSAMTKQLVRPRLPVSRAVVHGRIVTSRARRETRGRSESEDHNPSILG
jgi:hypothetical protein